MLRELLETILKEIPNANDQKVADKLSDIFKQSLPEALEELANEKGNDRYDAEGNVGTPGMKSKDKVGYLPVVYLYDTYIKQNDRFNSDPFYIVYILREDRQGIYLSLNRSQEYMKRLLEEKEEWDSWYGGNLEKNLIKDVLFIREKINIPESLSEVMNLGKVNSKNAKFYEAASLCSKYYTLENLPSEEELVNDLKVLLNFYDEVDSLDYVDNISDVKRMNAEAKKFVLTFQRLKSIKKDYGEFISRYPFKEHPEIIDVITPDDIYNKGYPPYFLTYLEHKLTDCGLISVGQATYAENARKKIDKFKELIKIAVDDSTSISKKVDATWEDIKFWGGDKHLAKKIIFLYNPKKILPIYKTAHLEHFANLIDPEFKSEPNKFNKPYEELSLGEKFEFLNDIILQFKRDKIKAKMDNVSFMHFLYQFSHPDRSVKVWCFTVNMELNPDFKERKKDIWNSAKDVNKGDIILFYCGKPYSHIADIFIALSDPYEDEQIAKDWNKPAIEISKQIVIKNPLNWEEMQSNDILNGWAAVRMYFGKSHFRVSDKEWEELKRMIIEKNPEVEVDIKALERGKTVDKGKYIPNVFLTPPTIETNLKLKSEILEQVCGTLNSKKHIMLTGAPGTGKTHLAEDVCKVAKDLNFINGYILTTATSDWTTFDTIGGYMPDEDGKLYFEEGKFLQSIRENKWLIIDEINRADIDKAFGQLFTVLSGQGVELPYKIDGSVVKILRTDQNKSFYDEKTTTYHVGKNWRILATMNIYDKDYLFEMSYAFMRRFTFVYIDLPVDDEFKKLIRNWSKTLSEDYLLKIDGLLEINKYRELGPAIFKDMIEYVEERYRIGSENHVLEDAVLSFIMPQFEGLEKPDILSIWKILQETFEESEMLKKRMEEISTIKLDELK